MLRFVAILLCVLAVFPCAPQEYETPQISVQDWRFVIRGVVRIPPVPLSDGFALLTEGRLVSACTADGILRWQQVLPGNPAPILASDAEDFLYAVIDDSHLVKLNPDGILLWTSDAEDTIILPPFAGRDGRVFVCGTASVSCFDLAGVRKWRRALPLNGMSVAHQFPLMELNDGSLLVIAEATGTRGSRAIRLSPYGDILEEIVLADVPTSAAQTDSGVALMFPNGELKLYAVKKNAAQPVWTYREKTAKSLLLASPAVCALVVPSGKKTIFTMLDSETGKVAARYTLDIALDTASPSIAEVAGGRYSAKIQDARIIVADKKAAACVSSEGVQWVVSFAKMTDWEQLCYAPNVLVFFTKDWLVNGYRVSKTDGKMDKPAKIGVRVQKTYWQFTQDEQSAYGGVIRDTHFLDEIDAVTAALAAGDYGSQELHWIQETEQLKTLFFSRFDTKIGRGVSETSILSTKDETRIIELMSKFGTGEFSPDIAHLLSVETDPTILREAILAAEKIAYDPDGKLLIALEKAIRTPRAVEGRLKPLARTAAYSICRYMGRSSMVQVKKFLY